MRAYLTHLAVEGNVAASTQNQALSALLFLYGQVLHLELPFLQDVGRARRPKKLPVVPPATKPRRCSMPSPTRPINSWAGCSTAAACA